MVGRVRNWPRLELGLEPGPHHLDIAPELGPLQRGLDVNEAAVGAKVEFDFGGNIQQERPGQLAQRLDLA